MPNRYVPVGTWNEWTSHTWCGRCGHIVKATAVEHNLHELRLSVRWNGLDGYPILCIFGPPPLPSAFHQHARKSKVDETKMMCASSSVSIPFSNWFATRYRYIRFAEKVSHIGFGVRSTRNLFWMPFNHTCAILYQLFPHWWMVAVAASQHLAFSKFWKWYK